MGKIWVFSTKRCKSHLKTIYKYQLASPGETILMLPKGAKVLKVTLQKIINQRLMAGDNILTTVKEDLMLWALVNPDRKTEKRVFTVKATGEELDNEIQHENYIDSYIEGPYVGHVFELIRGPRLVPDNHDPVPPLSPQPMRAI